MSHLQYLVLPDNFREWSDSAATLPIQPPLLWKLCIRDTRRLSGTSILSFQNPSVTHLHVDSFLLIDPFTTTASINNYANLRHLDLYIHGWQWDVTLADILECIGPLHNLASLRFLFEDATRPSESLTHTDAVYIGYTWPNLCFLDVSQADFGFFQMILKLPLLAELELNAYFWDDVWPTAAVDILPVMCALCFSNSPERWVE